jgi:hypothetical protein
MSSWTTGDSDALTRCGHCDNCMRPAGDVDRKDVTVEAWQLLKITAAVQRDGGNLTLNMLAGLARGTGGGVYEVSHGGGGKKGKGKTKEKMTLDLDDVAGGVVELTKDVGLRSLLLSLVLLSLALGNRTSPGGTSNSTISAGKVQPDFVCNECVPYPRTASSSPHTHNARESQERAGPEDRVHVPEANTQAER